MRDVTAEIVAVGTEILLGEITDTNSVFLARALRDMGINVYYMTTVGDNRRRIAEAIRLALSRADVVITCGGLGPTVDDMTRDGVADATDRSLAFQQHLLDQITARFAAMKAQMTVNNRQQAYVPEGAVIVENPVGTAPCFIVEQGDKCVLSLPGVPREMKYLFTERIVPYLRERYGLGSAVIRARVLKAAGIGESMLDDMLGKELLNAGNPSIGLAAHSGQIDIRITAKAESDAAADAMIDVMEEKVRVRVGRYIYGTDGASLAQAVQDALSAVHLQLRVVEIGVPSLISDHNGPLTQYDSVDAAAAILGMDVSAGLRQFAEGVAARMALPGEAVVVMVSRAHTQVDAADAAERSALAVHCGDTTRARAYGFAGDSEEARQFMPTWGLSFLWRMLRDLAEADHAG